MERIDPVTEKKHITLEHIHRYVLAREVCSGDVLDISCGNGYGAEILKNSQNFKSYTGIDISEEAVTLAKSRYEKANIKFEVGDINNINKHTESFDTVICYETLEHIQTPEKAFSEIKRVLKHSGIFIGSVPTKDYDEFCENLFGINPFHTTRFTLESLKNYLNNQFKFYKVFLVNIDIGSKVYNINSFSEDLDFGKRDIKDDVYGSFVFFASEDQKSLEGLEQKLPSWQYGMSLAELEKNLIEPYQEAITSVEKVLLEKSASILDYEKSINDKNLLITELESTLTKRWQIIEEYDKAITEKDLAYKIESKVLLDEINLLKEKLQEKEKTLDLILSSRSFKWMQKLRKILSTSTRSIFLH